MQRRLSADEVREIRLKADRFLHHGMNKQKWIYRLLAFEYGVHIGTIDRIMRRVTHRSVI